MAPIREDPGFSPATMISIHKIVVRGTFGQMLAATLATAEGVKHRLSRMLRIYFWVSMASGLVLAIHLTGKSPGIAALIAISTLLNMAVVDMALHFIQKLHENFVALHKASAAMKMELVPEHPSTQ